MKIKLDREDLLDLQIALKKEYLLTNGKGGYCSSTVLDCHTRKYHSLLAASLPDRNSVVNFLSKIEMSATIKDNIFHLSTNKFPNVYSPTGHKYIEHFEYNLIPETYYTIGDILLKKSVMMLTDQNTTMVRYEVVRSEKPIKFRAEPLLAFRDIHSLSKQNMDIQPKTFYQKNGFKISLYPGLPGLHLQSSLKSVFYPSPDWWYNFEYLKERNRGYDYQEDLFCPGVFEFTLSEGKSIIFRASLDKTDKTNFTSEWNKNLSVVESKQQLYPENTSLDVLKFQSDKLIFKNNNKPGIIAGYHWYREWTRDALVAMNGLMLCRGQEDDAFALLKKYAGLVTHGQLPKIVLDDGGTVTDAIDPSLLFIRAIQEYQDHTGDLAQVKRYLAKAAIDILESLASNKIKDVFLGEDGLLYAGTAGTRHTWMDAEVDGRPVTPRHGAAVEINAWWYNNLRFVIEKLKDKLNPGQLKKFSAITRKFEENFENKFWNEQDGCLIDVYRSDHDKDTSIRPNQLYAVGLPFTCISNDKAISILEVVERHLVTSYGLRTLSPRNPMYQAEYKGNREIRAKAYHQGMVWPFFVGIYMDALLKNNKDHKEVADYMLTTFDKLFHKHLKMYGLLGISELFRPNPPQVAKGCLLYARSMGEAIRVLETVKKIRS